MTRDGDPLTPTERLSGAIPQTQVMNAKALNGGWEGGSEERSVGGAGVGKGGAPG